MTIFLTWLHVLAAMSWIGGMVFLSLVLVPVLRTPALAPQRGQVFPVVARQFRVVGWAAIFVLLSTGPVLALARGVDLGAPASWPSSLQVKLGLVALLVGMTALHDLLIGPRVSAIVRKPEADRTAAEGRLVRWAPILARGSLLLALAVLYCAVQLARV